MEKNFGYIIILAACLLVLLIGAMRKKSELFLNFILRSVFGALAIYFINQFVIYQELPIAVGMNPITVLTSGILGFPGLLLLYGINLYKFL